MTEQLKQAIIESGKQYFRSIIIRGVWRVEQKVIGNALRSLLPFSVIFRCTFFTYLIVSTLRFNRYDACFCFLNLREKQIQVVDYQNLFCNLCTTLLFASFFCSVYGCKGNKKSLKRANI